uniref:Isochorismatase-like domain-containing protein n=1 Tax=Oryza nivara TaxID=4536 RepID=A0A0E0H9M1_ORYNI
MTSHLALMSCLLVLLLSLDKFLLHYLKKRWLSPRISTSPSKSRRSMAAAAAGGGGAKWSETAMLVIDMQKDFVDPAMRSPMLVDGGQAVVPTVAEAVAVARERGIYVVWSRLLGLVECDEDCEFRGRIQEESCVACGALSKCHRFLGSVQCMCSSVGSKFVGGFPSARRFGLQVVREHDPSGADVEIFRRRYYSGGKGPTVKGLKGADLADGLVIKEGEYKLVKTRFSAFFATPLDSVLKTSGIKKLVIVGVQTPNCIRQTVFDAVALDYEKVTVIIDATAAARPEIHLCE